VPGRVGVDFGTSNTVIAVWNDSQQTGVPVSLPEYTKLVQQSGETVPVIPSLIHYADAGKRWIGDQVNRQNLYHSAQTFRWMKRYINNRNPATKHLLGREITWSEAGRDFLMSVLLVAAQDLKIGDEEIVLTVPVESFEHYDDWLAEIAEAAGMPRLRLIDEPSAAALGYGAHVQPGNVYLIFDFGGGTLDVALVLIEEEKAVTAGRRCRVLGKAGRDLGGMTIDQWFYQEILRRCDRSDADEDVREISNELLVQCESAKERLSFHERAEVMVVNPHSGAVLSAEFTRSEFEELLDQRNAYAVIDQAVRSALNTTRERGYKEDDIQSVLTVGGSSQIPSVQRTLQRIFGRERVFLDRPLDAVARGAAAFAAGVDFYDYIQHDYAVRYVDPVTVDYDYRIIVKRGTAYPTKEPVATLRVKATYDGQAQLGLAIYEMGEQHPRQAGQAVELVFDQSGAARIRTVAPDDDEQRHRFWMNEHNPTFLAADPLPRQGEARFEVEFGIDGNKRLLVTARDLKTGRLTHKDFPVIKLA
jgi:molecular chaperone DnaK